MLLRLEEGSFQRFRCHTGHAYTLEVLLSLMDEKVEDTLWNAVRAIEERVMLTRHAAGHARENDAELLLRAEAAQRRADPIRQALTSDAETDPAPAEKLTGT